ncbi:MAG: fibronectin type III domain-containing protein [Candidatus Omnitrophica bacterium]|nr:fibronectin type III domain-containing protein [Candidatus Omnitrophota bacterium]
MTRKTSLLLITSLFIFTSITPAHAFHNGGSGALTAGADTQSGSANFSVPIDVPPGRAGIQPNIQLQYSSSLPNGPLGVGWSLELGSIQRSTKKGVPSYTDSDTFVLIQGGRSQELVYDSGGGFYRAKQEGAFLRAQKIGDEWVVTDKKGIKYCFGTTQDAQEYDPDNASRIFKWVLSSVEDLQGNTMTITYWRDRNKLYPQYIDYTSNPLNGLASFARVEFRWEIRPDPIMSYAGGYNIQMLYRLERINTLLEGAVQYQVVVNYHQSNTTGRYLLDNIRQYEANVSSSLPPLTFQYQESSPAYTAAPVTIADGEFFGDFNGDGRMDKVLYDQSAGNLQVALSNGAGFQSPSVWYGNLASGVKLLSGNFDSDGVTDLCVFYPSSGNWDVLFSNGQNQFVSQGTWITGFRVGYEPTTGDFNGDGLTDVAYFFRDGSDNMRVVIALNAGGYFREMPAATPIISNSFATGISGDFNGDGLTDSGVWRGSDGYWETHLNPGNINGPFPVMVQISNFGPGKQPVIADLNFDGLTDIGYYDSNIQKVVYRLSNGTTFGNEQSLSLGWNVSAVQSVDFNGDGLPDFAAGTQAIYATGTFPDILSGSNNGVGGTTTIEYAPSTTFNNPQLPFPLQLVKSASQSNNRGDVYMTRYEYSGGLWDGADREFHGFGLVKVTDPDGNYMETQFRQDSPFHGRPVEQRAYDSGGRLFGKTVYTWDSQQIKPGVNFVYLKRQDGYVYDGDSTGRRTAQEFSYGEPELGNMTKTVQWGEVDLATGIDVGTDKRSVETIYANNTDNWLIGSPRWIIVKDNADNIIRQVWFYYENQGNEIAPVKGLLTKKEEWAGTGNIDPLTQYSYDAIGNLSTTTDPKGNITRVTYDSAYQMFPLTTENALGHKVSNEYYGVNGVFTGLDGLNGLWGQVRSTTDPNQKQGRRGYDIFGRLTTTISPLDSVTYPTQTTAIEYFSDYTKVTSRQRIKSGQPQTIDVVSFYDGLGRLIQTKTPTEVPGQYVVSGQTEYNYRGLVSNQYLPFFSTGALDTIVSIDPGRPHSSVEYDAMGRPVKTINPDGTFAGVSYDDWTAAATDENGHMQKSYFDAYGRLVKKEEYTGADGRSPYYPGTPTYTLYATTLYSYDSEGNLVQTKDAYNNTTTITYDVLGRKTAMTDPNMGHWSYQYDLNGNLTKQIDAKGQTLAFTYDALNRLTNKTDGVNGTVNVNYTYDNATASNFAKGRLTQAAYSGGNTQFAYDELGRELQSIKAMNTTDYSVNRGYDALNNLLQVQYPDQKNIYYQYNPAGQIEAISNDAAILPQSLNWGGEKAEQFAYSLDFARGSTWLTTRPEQGRTPPRRARDSFSRDDKVRDTRYERRATRTFLLSVGEWLERHVLGVGDAYAQTALPSPWIDQDIGAVGVEGSASQAGGVFTVKGSGSDIYNSSDSFHFVYQTLNGDGEIVAKVESVQNTYSWAKAGVMMREDLTAGSRNAFMLMSAAQGTAFQRRKSPTYSTSNTSGGTGLRAPYWVKLTRSGNTFKAWQSANGTTWAQVGPTETVTMTSTVYVGLAVTSHANTVLNTSLLSNVQVNVNSATSLPPAPALNTATAGNGEVALSWSATSGATGYKVYYGTSPTLYGTPVSVGNTTTATVTGLTNGTTYYFVVSGINAGGESVRSNAMSATPAGLLAAPVLNTATAGDKQVTLSWAAATGATGYKIYYGTAPGVYGGTPTDAGNVTTKAVTGLTNGTTYYFAVTAYNAGGESVKSNEVSATPVSATLQPLITLEAETMPTKTTGGAVTDGWNIWSNGYIESTVSFPENTTYEFQIIAKGSYAGGAWPNMELRIDQTVNASFTVNTTGWSSYTRQITVPSGIRKVAIAFTNDYYVAPDDRNLYVDKVVILKVVLDSPPSAPVLNTATAGDKQVTLSWAAATGATGYKIYYSTAPGVYGGTPVSVGNVTTSTVTGLTNGTTYYFAVSATNTGGESVKSNEVNATPAAPMTEDPTLFIKNVDYNAAGQMTKVEYGNGNVTEYTYNPLNLRLTRLKTYDLQLTTIQDLNYTYDSAGNILSIDDKVNTADQTFKYDELNRLVEAVNPNPGSYGTKAYTYDQIGNIVAKDGKTYFYGGSSGGPHAVTALSDGTAFTYDADGNMVTKVESGVTTDYKYDAENRLIEVKKGGSIIGQYTYDGDGGRTTKVATVSGQTTTTTYVGSLFETSGARTTKFIFLGGQRVAAVTNSPSIGSTTLYYHADHLGGANVLTDATGFKKELIEYEPFGQESRHEKYGSSEEIAWYYFTGKKTDDESGLIYFGARYYDPKLGRFITPDTIVPYPSDPQSFNRYSYARNNPVNVIDPTGHKWSWTKFWHAAVGAIVGVVAAIVLGPAGLALVGSTMAGIIGGAVGGAITGGLEGGWKGALMGAAFGGALGGVGGWAIGGNHYWALGGMFAAGTAYAGATDSWDSYTGGFVGGIAGAAVGNGLVNSQQFQNFKAGKGFVSNRTVALNEYNNQTKEWNALNVNKADTTVTVVSRPLGGAKGPGSLTGPRHNVLISDKLPNGKWEMGPYGPDRLIQTTDTAENLSGWGTHLATEQSLGLGGRYAVSFDVRVNLEGLQQSINLYNTTIAGQYGYSPTSFNSNYAVNSVIYGAGGTYQGNSYRAPGFPNGP